MHILKYLSLSLLITVFFISCEKDDSTIIDPVLHFPHVDTAYVTPDTFDTSSVNATAFAKVSSEEAITSVTATVKDPVGFERQFTLLDDGVSPDLTAGDGWYTGTINFSMSCRLVGTYNVTFIAKNVSGLSSNTLIDNFNVINSNNTNPVISNLIIPDSLHRPSSCCDTSFLQLVALDPEGQCDVKDVFFTSIKPNGDTTTCNPCFMYNDGTHCDTVASDTKYSLCILIANTAQIGYYKFLFNAKDRSNSLSNTLIDSIYIYP